MNKVVVVSVPPNYQNPEDDYVGKLFRALQRNLTEPFEFEVRRQNVYRTWFNKILLFDPDERIVFLDLDTVIVGNVDFLFEYQGDFCILRDFNQFDHYGSAVMNISKGYGKHISESYAAWPKDSYNPVWGDQDWIRQCVDNADLWQELFPDKIVSYKCHDCEQGLPEGAAIVCFHGSPKNADVAHLPFMQEHWR